MKPGRIRTIQSIGAAPSPVFGTPVGAAVGEAVDAAVGVGAGSLIAAQATATGDQGELI